jgi:hypothetical protein
MPPRLSARLRPTIGALRQISTNRSLLRLQLGSVLWSAADGMYVVGLAVLAYQHGGTTALALVAISRALPSVFIIPWLLAATEAMPRDRLLRLGLATRVACLLVSTVLVIGDQLPVVIYLLAAIDAVAGAHLRPFRAILQPALARSTEELVAANVATTSGDALAAMLGPGGAALLLVAGDVPATYVAGTLMMALALAAVFPVRAAPKIDTRARAASSGVPPGSRRSVRQSIRDLLAMPHARLIVLLFGGQRFVRGVITVALVAAAFDVLQIGDAGVGVLTSAIGLGGLLGGAVALGLVGRERLAPAFAAGLIAWGGGILASGAFTNLFLVVVALAIAGIGKTALDTSGYTLLQRTVPNDRRSGVFGLLEGVIAAAFAAGPVAAAVLVDAFGADWTLILIGALPLVLVAVSWPTLRSTDDAAVVPQPAFQLLTGVAMFRPLQLTTLETLASEMVRREAPAGSDVVRQGDQGDSFYIVESGRLATLIDGTTVNELGPGDSFGEIALLRSIERTATVRALEDSRLVELAGGPFLAAITSTGESLAAADTVLRTRLGVD